MPNGREAEPPRGGAGGKQRERTAKGKAQRKGQRQKREERPAGALHYFKRRDRQRQRERGEEGEGPRAQFPNGTSETKSLRQCAPATIRRCSRRLPAGAQWTLNNWLAEKQAVEQLVERNSLRHKTWALGKKVISIDSKVARKFAFLMQGLSVADLACIANYPSLAQKCLSYDPRSISVR